VANGLRARERELTGGLARARVVSPACSYRRTSPPRRTRPRSGSSSPEGAGGRTALPRFCVAHAGTATVTTDRARNRQRWQLRRGQARGLPALTANVSGLANAADRAPVVGALKGALTAGALSNATVWHEAAAGARGRHSAAGIASLEEAADVAGAEVSSGRPQRPGPKRGRPKARGPRRGLPSAGGLQPPTQEGVVRVRLFCIRVRATRHEIITVGRNFARSPGEGRRVRLFCTRLVYARGAAPRRDAQDSLVLKLKEGRRNSTKALTFSDSTDERPKKSARQVQPLY
jgi:hypothetical protein